MKTSVTKAKVANTKAINKMALNLMAGLMLVLSLGAATSAQAQTRDIELRCSTTVYLNFMELGTERGHQSEFKLNICAEDSNKECGSKTKAIKGLADTYEFNAYLTNEPGHKPEINIAVNSFESTKGLAMTLASRDLKDSGFLALKINDDYLVIGCGLRK